MSLYFKTPSRRIPPVGFGSDRWRFEGWLKFFLEGVAAIADETVATTRKLFGRISADRTRVLSGRTTSVAGIRLFEYLPAHPIMTVAEAVKLLRTTKPTATKAVSGLVDAGVLAETTGRCRDHVFSYEAYLNLLCAETDPLR